MALQERLDRIKASFRQKAPAEVLEIMHRATTDLRASGIVERALREGQQAPGFTLESSAGGEICLADLRALGPVVLTFFRGHW